MKITLQLTQSQISRQAMIMAGLNPKDLAMKPGTRVERNKKLHACSRKAKHKNRLFD